MRKLLCGLVLFGTCAFALPVTINDTCWGVPACTGSSAAYDVIGALGDFDIQKIVVSQLDTAKLDMTFYFNFDANSTLAPWIFSGRTLNVGDALFYVAGNVKYGIPLRSRGGSGDNPNPNAGKPSVFSGATDPVVAGTLYQASAGALISDEVFGTGVGVIRNNTDVWLDNRTGNLTALDSGTVSIVYNGAWSSGDPPEFEVRVVINNPDVGFLLDIQNFGGEIGFASATCANDIIRDRINTSTFVTPEPGTYALLGAGLVGLFLARRRRNRV